FFAGPMRRDILNRPGPSSYGLDDLVGGGVTHYLQLLFTYILYLFQMVTRNWGLAIILLTVLVRLCMHPLTKKSQVAMHHMQELQPRMKELQEKHKNDKQKLQQETMKLQKEAGFPMFKGCLPMFFQLPIFIALWWSLRTNIFLRGAYLLPPSVGWLDDLSQPDRLYMFSQPVSILFLTIYEINLLPILMVAAMVVQQQMQPKSSNPEQAQQQKVMAVMMSLIFLFFFYTMPSGLTLYFLISTSWGIVEGRIIRKHIDELKSKKALYGKADS
ncbi:MAG: YidC/Oxa1 family membrane protein insertase, partial [Planctomycetota bacterium]